MGLDLGITQPDSEQAVTDTNVRTATTRKDEIDVLRATAELWRHGLRMTAGKTAKQTAKPPPP